MKYGIAHLIPYLKNDLYDKIKDIYHKVGRSGNLKLYSI